MVDYYSILFRAVTAPGAGDAKWRRNIYDRSRVMLANRMRALRPVPSLSEIAKEEAALEAAIERIEAELDWTEHGSGDRGPEAHEDETFDAAEAERGPIAEASRFGRPAWIAVAVVVAALGAGGYAFWVGKSPMPAPAAVKSEAPSSAQPAPAVKVAKDGELAPGVDGGASDPDQPYVFRRQPTFYRTLQPVGTVIIDKLQRFLYLIRPNNVALRYGIALGKDCADLNGLRHISSMSEWPQWQPPPEMLNHSPAAMAGGTGNPLGARLMQLDDNSSRIHGTNAPKTIGNVVAFGCIRLANDDIVDLYRRVKVSTPVIVN
jgi:lipoprotein-anchoring transpeptidase ErfK/SrfK